jgi:hypothetical protein
VAAAGGDEPCFDGRASPAAAELCAAAPLAQSYRGASGWPGSSADGGGEGGVGVVSRALTLEVVQALRSMTLTAAIGMLLVRLFQAFQRQRDLQVALRRAEPEVLAQAAIRRVSAE